MKPITVLLVDDHELVMDGIESILNESPNIQVVAKAASVSLAEMLIRQHQPDLVLTDISMGERSGLLLTQQITQQFPWIRVLVLSMHSDVEYIASLIKAGAVGYLLKNVKQGELFMAIEAVMDGRQYIQQSIADQYARARQLKEEVQQKKVLTPREIEIIRLIAQEVSTIEISRQLFLSELTVETHRKNIYRKTGVKTIVGLMNYAREQGLL